VTAEAEYQHPCCWPDCDGTAMWQDKVPEWFLCFSHTAVAVEFADRTALGLKAGEPLPVKDAARRTQRGRTNVRNRQRGDYDGWVYYARIGEHIKIGYARDVKKRMADYPPETVVLAVEPGDKQLERDRHKEFTHSLMHGREWFRESYPIRQHIEKLREIHGPKLADLNHTFRKHNNDSIKSRYSSQRTGKGYAL
jgi:hypothetical protein